MEVSSTNQISFVCIVYDATSMCQLCVQFIWFVYVVCAPSFICSLV